MTLESFCRLAGTFIEDVAKGFFLGCIVIAGGAIGLATASPQPALTLRAEPVPVSSLARFDQAQRGER